MAMPPIEGWGPGPNLLETDTVRHKSRFRRKHDNGKPIRCVTAYDVFLRNTYPWLKDKRPDLTQQQLFSEIGRLWREGSTWHDRQICYDYADWEKDTYDLAIMDWKIRRRQQKEREKQKQEKKTTEKTAGEPTAVVNRERDPCNVQ